MPISNKPPISANILITGFRPFLSFRSNPSAAVAEAFVEQSIPNGRLTTRVLRVDYAECDRFVHSGIIWPDYTIVIMLGLNARSRRILIERIAINMEHSTSPDDRGDIARNRPIVPNGPAGIFSNWPVDALQTALMAEGFPAGVSNSAGTYVCNSLFYRVLHQINLAGGSRPLAGFVHLPRASHRWRTSRMIASIRVLIESLLKISGGCRE